jgi:hypothetical protein
MWMRSPSVRPRRDQIGDRESEPANARDFPGVPTERRMVPAPSSAATELQTRFVLELRDETNYPSGGSAGDHQRRPLNLRTSDGARAPYRPKHLPQKNCPAWNVPAGGDRTLTSTSPETRPDWRRT